MDNIKSAYIFKNIFTFISPKSKLKLIIYNKKLQSKLDTTLKSYKEVSGICREIDKEGFGQEINLKTKKLIFKGKYLNKKRNGLGVEYRGKIKIFVGEYINGLRNGKGKEYNESNKLTFEGEFLNGKKHGNGKEYRNGKLIFEGQYINGKIVNGIGYDAKKGVIDFQIKDGK